MGRLPAGTRWGQAQAGNGDWRFVIKGPSSKIRRRSMFSADVKEMSLGLWLRENPNALA